MFTTTLRTMAVWLQSQLRLPESEGGQTLVEYALILLFVAIALVASLQLLGSGLIDAYDYVTGQIPSSGG